MSPRAARSIRAYLGFPAPAEMALHTRRFYRSLKAQYTRLPHDQRTAWLERKAREHHEMVGSLAAATQAPLPS